MEVEMKQYNNMYKKDEVKETFEKEAKEEIKEVEKDVKEEVKEEAPVKVAEKKEVKEEEPANVNRIRHAKVVNCAQLNVRSEASIMASVVEIIPEGEVVDILGVANDFTKVHTNRGMNGYCMSDYLKEV